MLRSPKEAESKGSRRDTIGVNPWVGVERFPGPSRPTSRDASIHLKITQIVFGPMRHGQTWVRPLL